jgi:hypothetical protein
VTSRDHEAAYSAGVGLAGELATTRIVDGLRAADVEPIVLKGPVTTRWLHPTGTVRYSTDIDLLVAPEVRQRAHAYLHRIGYEQLLSSQAAGSHATTWVREGSFSVDLHRSLVGVGVDEARAWQILANASETADMGESTCQVLDATGRTLHVVLHAAQHGPRDPRVLEDLSALLELVSLDDVAAAQRLAHELDASGAFAAGLGIDPRGRSLRSQLSLAARTTTESELRAAGAPALALGVERLASTRGTLGRMKYLWSEVVPERAFMRVWHPVASRGPLGLAAAYLFRPFWLAARLPRALAAFRHARRRARARGDD